MCEFHDCNCNGLGDIWWTDKCMYFSSIDGLDLLARLLKYSANSAIFSSGVFTLAPSFAFFDEVAMAVIFDRLVSRSRPFIDFHFTFYRLQSIMKGV